MDNTERSDSAYVNTEESENPNFIENSGEAMATSSSLLPQRKRPLINPPGQESDGLHQKRFKIVLEEKKYRWSLLLIWLNMPMTTQKSLYLTRM